MADPLLLPLRPSVLASSSKDSLQARIAQINKQKGAFRYVTEASLLEEINHGAQSDSDIDTENEANEDAFKLEDRQALLWKGREAMLRQIDHARNETLTALDFISALLSKQVTAAQVSMSPVLKEAVPVGSLECRVVKHVPAPVTEKRRVEMTRRGWKMDSFASAAEKISAAGSRLQEEAERESRYWEQISNLKAKGWAVSRLPRDSRTVGVHFGLAEAAPAFRNRGFAILRRGQDGNVSLDHSVIPLSPLVVMVTVSVGGQESGSSVMRHTQATEDSPIEDQILQACKTLSEEELFYEIGREGRLLANQGVEMSTTVVKFDFGENSNVQLRLVNPEKESIPASSSIAAENIAETIALSLRILLAHAHQQNLYRRSNPPPPMTLKARAAPEFALLRPVMSYLQHTSHLDGLRSFIGSVLPPLSNAGVNARAGFSILKNWSLSDLSETSSLRTSDLLEPLTAPLESTITLALPTERSLELSIRTFLGSPVFGTEFSVKPLIYATRALSSPRLETVAEVEKFVLRVIMVDLAVFIEGLHTTSENAGKKDEAKKKGAIVPAQPSWRITDFHSAELSLHKSPGSIEKLQVRVWRDRLGLRHIFNLRKGSGDIVPYIWSADKFWKTTASSGQQNAQNMRLSEVIKSTLQGMISSS